MKAPSNKMLTIWNVVLTVVLLVSLAGNAVWVQAASDPPVRVFTAGQYDSGVDQSSTTTDDDITSTTNDTLVSVTFTLSASHTHGCVATASADAYRSVDTTGNYIFGLSLDDSAATAAASDRQIEFVATSDVDVIHQEVSTALGFDSVTGGPHTIRFMARKVGAGDPNMTVRASSIILVCIKKQL